MNPLQALVSSLCGDLPNGSCGFTPLEKSSEGKFSSDRKSQKQREKKEKLVTLFSGGKDDGRVKRTLQISTI